MKRIRIAFICCLMVLAGMAQNIELRNGKDFKQPGKINPALAGVQEDFVRVLTDADIGNSYQLMFDGKIPFKLGNYMVGWERLYTDNVQDDMFNITYGNGIKRKNDAILKKNKKPFQFRYGATVQIHTKNLVGTGFDSTEGYNFTDINGEIKNVPALDDLKTSINYINIELGAGFTFKNLFGSVGVHNILTPDVSMIDTVVRNLPFAGNIVLGGFLNMGEKFTIFPSVLVDYSSDHSYVKAAIDGASEKMTFSASYFQESEIASSQYLSGSLGYRFKKNSLIGVKYSHPFEDTQNINALPSFNVYLNSSVIKSPKLFMSDLGKQLKKFY